MGHAPARMAFCGHAVVAGREAACAGKRHMVSDHGAVGDGTTLNTFAIQKTIEMAAAAGGGVVVIPPGTFRSGSIFLKAGVELHVAAGAVLFGSADIADYPKRETRIEGRVQPWRMALVNAQRLDRVRMSGEGVLNGNGVPFWQAFWRRRAENPNCTNLEVERPRLVLIDCCRDVSISGLSFEDAGFWNLHLYRCRDVEIRELRITIPSAARFSLRAPSTDGIDIDSSQNIAIRRCTISTNDDNIALKGRLVPKPVRALMSPWHHCNRSIQ